MEYYRSPEIPLGYELPETAGRPENVPFQSPGPEPTALTPADGESALDHKPQPSLDLDNIFATEARFPYEARDSVAAQACAEKSRLMNVWRIEGPDVAEARKHEFEYAFADEILEQRSMRFDGQRLPTEQECEVLAVADAGLEAIAAKANVILGPVDSPTRYFDDPRAYDKVAALYSKKPGTTHGYGDALRGMLWSAHGFDPTQNDAGQVHERVHQRSQWVVVPTLNGRNSEGAERIGVSLLPATDYIIAGESYISEAITDMAEMRIMRGAKRPAVSMYVAMDIFLEEAIKETAKKAGASEQLVEFSLYRSILGGDPEGITMVRDACGVDRSERLFTLNLVALEGVADAARQLEMPGAARTVERYFKTGIMSLFPWQPQK